MNRFQKTVLEWYRDYGRKLPWRETIDPYAILVSEMMLQQTQVDRVVPKYHAFLAHFPTAEALATAPTSEVLKLWSGLGYNRRALYLQRCAQHLVKMKSFPTSAKDLEKLPGIGTYTAAAVQSFAFNKAIVVVDVNIELLYKRAFYGRKESVESLAQQHLPSERSRDWHNALMDIGALFCTSNNPKCAECPLKRICASAGNEQRIEETRKKKKVVPFKTSDRIVRGTILKLLMVKAYSLDDMYAALLEQGIERTQDHFQRIVSQLTSEGLVDMQNNRIQLP